MGHLATHGMNPSLQKLRCDPIADVELVGLFGDSPRLEEAGVDVTLWYAFFASAKAPRDIVQKITKLLNEVLADKETEKRMVDHGADVRASTPQERRAPAASEPAKWKGVAHKAKLTAG